MAEESKKTDGSRTPEKHEDIKDSQASRMSSMTSDSQQFMDQLREKFPSLDSAKGSIIEDSRGRRTSISQRLSGTLSGASSRASSLSAKSKELWKKHAHISIPENSSTKPKQKDPLHQWMVDHSGGTVSDKP
ncbi:hypothetical protein F5Y02DRAFT_427867 [Annulohypoxylon stygium]|nr:hypothetical protein F5Y02DRAFT_427867 [Annulohypoxylon stygium]